MNKNLNYLYEKILNNTVLNKFELSLFKNFISLYSDNDYLKDSLFLKYIDLPACNLLKSSDKVKFNLYNKFYSTIPKHAQKIIFVNGFYYSSENIHSNIYIKYFKNYLVKEFCNLKKNNFEYIKYNLNFFYILNFIFNCNILYIDIPDYCFIKRPLYILNIFKDDGSNSMIHPKFFLNVGKQSNINVMEAYFNLSKNIFVNSVTNIHLKEASHVNYNLTHSCKYFLPKSHSFFSRQDSRSFLNFNEKSSGNQFYKGIYKFFLLGYNSKIKNIIGNHLKDNFVNDMEFDIFHYGIKSKSNILFKSLGDGSSKCFFRGNIIVGVDINKVDADLQCDGLLLTQKSYIFLMPNLFINNNDIKCSHGATIGYIDDTIVFYMMSRGLSKSICISIIIDSFLSKCIDKNSLFFSNLNDCVVNDYYKY